MHLGLGALHPEPERQHAKRGVQFLARGFRLARIEPQRAEPRAHQCGGRRIAARE